VIGFRPPAGLPGWLAVAGLLALASLALSWLSVGCGLWAKTSAALGPGRCTATPVRQGAAR